MTERPPPSDQVLMPLLNRITQQALDEDYRDAAFRRGPPGPEGGRAAPHRAAAVVVAVFGVLATTAFIQTTRNADVDSASRATLIARITERSELRSAQEELLSDLRAEVVDLQLQLSSTATDQQSADVDERRLGAGSGFVAVTGEGVRVTVSQPTVDVEVTDGDLADLANALWQAGAEAVAVDDQRLSTLSAIRFSSGAITVNRRAVAPPYVVEAIGDPGRLPGRLLESTSGRDFAASAELYGFEYVVDVVDELTLPAAAPSLAVLRAARRPGADDQDAGASAPGGRSGGSR